MSSKKMSVWIAAALAVAAFMLVELVHNAHTVGLREGREQACARLAQDHEVHPCAELIEKDVALDERVNNEMGAEIRALPRWRKRNSPPLSA